MKKKEEKYDECPVRSITELISNKWTLLVLYKLSNHCDLKDVKPLRFNELFKNVEGISHKMLTQTLKILEKDGFVNRKVYPVVPPKVEYSLTKLGESFIPIIMTMGNWAAINNSKIIKAREKYDG
ncbi:MAG: winged helix-turn-helix transcriptional regulator [Flavobacteriales bacterium]